MDHHARGRDPTAYQPVYCSMNSNNCAQNGGLLLLVAISACWAGAACESGGVHAGIEIDGEDCVSCHRNAYEAATAPLHVSELPIACGDCHAEDHWSPARGSDHADYFPLRDAHAEEGCGGCHEAGFDSGQTPTACVDCHQRDYDHAARPPHDDLPTDCGSCHNEAAFSPATEFEHSWPLQGQHALAACAGCHTGDPPAYAGTSTACLDCHADDRARAGASHDSYPDDCASCHTPEDWKGMPGGPGFAHPWPLEGAHGTAQCTSCHLGDPPVYAGTSRMCLDCHADDRARAGASHDSYPDDCASCHSPTDWDAMPGGPGFVHPWPLDGAHSTAACTGCHLGDPPVYAGTSRACVDCHQDDYDRSPYPGHDAFPTQCISCHSTSGWTPASGGHPQNRFSITGRHNYPCGDCHDAQLGSNGAGNADCVGCHDQNRHSRANMDGKHSEVRNYPAGAAPPNFCLDCHPDGSN